MDFFLWENARPPLGKVSTYGRYKVDKGQQDYDSNEYSTPAESL
jgi:hypothetical protein